MRAFLFSAWGLCWVVLSIRSLFFDAMFDLNNYFAVKICLRSVFWGVVLITLSGCIEEQPVVPELQLEAIYTGNLVHPAHVVYKDGYYLAAELFSKRVAISQNIGFEGLEYAEDKEGKTVQLASPHFIFPITHHRLLVSEGWGSEVALLDWHAHELEQFEGDKEPGFKAPHGVCYEPVSGWVYVADSVHSRLVRYQLEDKSVFEVFSDVDRKVAYGRQLLCDESGLWLSNSYEGRPGMNSGNGSNLLRITDFSSGKVDEIASFPGTNMTGVAELGERWLVIGLWGGYEQLVLVDKKGKAESVYLENSTGLKGPPYGLDYDRSSGRLLVSHIGDIDKASDEGGLVVYQVRF
jgi:hypothetical protein